MKLTPQETELWAQRDKHIEHYRLKAQRHAQNYTMKPSLLVRLFLRVGQKRRGWSGPRVD